MCRHVILIQISLMSELEKGTLSRLQRNCNALDVETDELVFTRSISSDCHKKFGSLIGAKLKVFMGVQHFGNNCCYVIHIIQQERSQKGVSDLYLYILSFFSPWSCWKNSLMEFDQLQEKLSKCVSKWQETKFFFYLNIKNNKGFNVQQHKIYNCKYTYIYIKIVN